MAVLASLLAAAAWLSRPPEESAVPLPVPVTRLAMAQALRNGDSMERRETVPPAFPEFSGWLARWESAGPDESGELEAEGVRLARDRRRRMADLIISRPEEALAAAIPVELRQRLPRAVADLIEEPLNAMGRFSVACARPAPGREAEALPLLRWAESGGLTYHVSTFGPALDWLSRSAVPLRGISLPSEAATNFPENPGVRPDRVLALHPDPAEPVPLPPVGEAVAVEPAVAGCDAVDPVHLRMGGSTHRFCCAQHAAAWSETTVAAWNLTQPETVAVMQPATAASGAVGATGATAASGLPTAASGYTEGYKRMLFLRPRFSDSSSALADTISDSRATALMNEFIAHMNRLSWGRIRIAPLGPGGSQITPALAMGKPAADYNDAGLSRLYPDARNAAAAAGFTLSDYAFASVFTGGRPSAGYAGLAYVGGVGIHIANGYYGLAVFVHEFGHNLGLPHAHRWDTSDNSIVGDGSNVEYGNDHDPMGSGGDGMHYTSSHKSSLDWIPPAEAARITAAGVYRLHVSDEPRSASGYRALRVNRSSSQDYWFDFRDTLSGTEYENGLVLHFANKDGKQSYRTDALPKQSGITLPVGMTFSDRSGGVFVTPLGQVPGTFPKAMDVAVGFPSAGNRPPVARLIQHSAHAASGADCTWTVEASDPDGDTLSYYWDFGDGSHSWNNQPQQTKSFGTDGEYAVHCVVSDRRGGSWRRTTVQKSGTLSATQLRISGRVLDTDNRPVPGIRVSTEGSLYAWTDSDGSYQLCRVPAGVRRIDAMDVVENRLVFSRTFSSTTNWTTSTAGADLSLTDASPETVTPLVPRLTLWKYSDSGTDLGTAWRARTYNDTAWPEGKALLGYGNGGEGTVISYGPDAQNKRITAYFRRKFTVANPSAFRELRLLCERDDAIMVYLNGTRIYSDNFPSTVTENSITYATTAADSTEPGTYQQQNGISPTLLVAGDNWLCAEVHQVEPTSSDLAFDAELLGIQDAPTPGAQAHYLSNPAEGERIAPGRPFTIAAEARARTATVTKVEFFLDGSRVGEDTTAPYSFEWTNPAAGPHRLHATATFSVGSPLTAPTVNVTVAAPPEQLIAAGSVWKWRASSTAAPSGWTNPEFNDSTWSSGPAPLGYGEGDEATNISLSGTRFLRTQFRRTFSVADPLALRGLLCRIVRDDAADVYVNGKLAFRHNFRADGTAQGAGPDENGWHAAPVDAALLRPGINTIAVELFQDSANSSDASFDLALEADNASPRPRGITLSAPPAALLPDVPAFTTEVLPGAALTVSKVEFSANGTKIGESTAWPFSFTWTTATAGSYSITAKATDSAGGTLTSTPVSLTVRHPAEATTIVKWGDRWKYLDGGSDPGPNWPGRTSFDDSTWPEGPARFGYGGDGEVTPLFFSDAAAKPPTVYFRKKFTVANPAAFDALRLRVIRDDGVSIQINRTEVLRDNLPEGTLSFSTLATSAPADEQSPVEIVIPTTSLRAGENQLTAEVHQNAIGSSDLSFDLELVGLKAPAPAGASVWLTAPAGGQTMASDAPLTISISSANLPAPIQRVSYFAGSAAVGESVSAPWTFLWPNALKGSYPLSARVQLTSGATFTTPSVPISVVSPTTTERLIWSGADWKFLDTGTAPAAAWTNASFSDSAWKTGRSRFGFGGDGETTSVTPGFPIYWFRRAFTVPAGVPLAAVQLRVIRDDGIQLFLNGNRIWLDNLPATPGPADLALTAISGAAEQTWITVPLPLSALQPGSNLFAAEIRQNSATSSDVGFDLELSISSLTPGGLVNSPPATAPVLSLAPVGSTGFTLSLPDAPGRIYAIESSPNLSTWITDSTHFLNTPTLTIPLSRSSPARFYRARWKNSP